MRIDFGLRCTRHCVARTCSTSLVPIPKASAPNAPCVAVWLSPQTIVMPGWVTPSSGPMTWTMPWCSRAERVDRDAELLAVALERLDLDAAELVLDERGGRRAVGRHVVVGGGERAVGAADRAAGQPQAVEGLRARDLVDEVQVDVDQARRHLVALPRSCRTAWSVGSCRCQLLRRPAATTASRTRLAVAGVLEVVGKVGVERHAVALGQRVALAVDVAARRRPCCTSAISRAPGSWIGGSPGPPVARAAARGRGARARRAGRAAAGSGPRSGGRARRRPGGARRARVIETAPASSRRSSWLRRRSSPAAMRRGDLQRRARLAPLDLAEHGRRDAGAARRDRAGSGPCARAAPGCAGRWGRR